MWTKLKEFSDIIKTEKYVITDGTSKECTSGRRKVIQRRVSVIKKE